MKRIVLIYFALFVYTLTFAQSGKKLIRDISNVLFVRNSGQWDNAVCYLANTNRLSTWVLNNGSLQIDIHSNKNSKENPRLAKNEKIPSSGRIFGRKINLNWLNSNPQVDFTPLKEGKLKYNYFIGNDPLKHKSNVPSFLRITGNELFPGIDITYYFEETNLRFDLIVNPGADPNSISFSIDGSLGCSIESDGNVHIKTEFEDIVLDGLFVYEKETGKRVDAKWVLLKNNIVKFSIEPYDKSKTLIIDPIIYSTFIGGDWDQTSNTIKVDNTGSAIIGGYTFSPNFLTTPGAYQTSIDSVSDCFIAKLDPTGSFYVFNTLIGGSLFEVVNDLAIDSIGNIYATGYSQSNDFDVTPGAFQTAFSSPLGFAEDVFVLKLNNNGSNLLYSTYLGGWSQDQGLGIDIDKNGNAYVCGKAISNDFDVSPGAYSTFFPGNYTAFLTKINPTGSNLIYSTFIGGTGGDDIANDVAVDKYGFAYITGSTVNYFNFITPGVHSSGAGGTNVFVTKFNQAGNALIYSTCIGGTGATMSVNSNGTAIAVDSIGNAYVTGHTIANNFDITQNAFQSVKGDTLLNEAFVFKLNPTASALVYSTYLGGNDHDLAYDIVIDKYGAAYICGLTKSTNFPATADAIQPLKDLSGDVFFTRLSPNGSYAQYSTFLGSNNPTHNDLGYGVDQKNSSEIYLTGISAGADFEITPGAIDEIGALNSPFGDGFVTKLTICPPMNFDVQTTNLSCFGSNNGSANITFQNSPTSPFTLLWSNGYNTDTISGLSSGEYYVTVSSSGGCSVIDTFLIEEPSSYNITLSSSNNNFCLGDSAMVLAMVSDSSQNYSYQWYINGSPSGTNDSILTSTFSNNDTVYCAISTSPFCSVMSDTLVFNVISNVTPGILINTTSNDTICSGTPVTFNATITNGGTNPVYQWQINGMPAGTNNPVFATNSLNSGDIVACILTSNLICVDTNNILSNSFEFYVEPIQTHTVNISANNNVICPGDSVLFTSSSVNSGSNPSYQWQVNGISVGGNSPSFTTNSLNNGDIISLEVISSLLCPSLNPAISNNIQITVEPCLPPVTSVSVNDNSICVNSCLNFTSSSINGATGWIWQFPGAVPSSSTSENPGNICYSSPGAYPISLITTNQYGNDTVFYSNYINVVNATDVSITGNTSITSCESTQLAAVPNDGTYLWGPSNNNSCVTCVTTEVSPDENEIYWVVYTNPEGCISSDSVEIKVENKKSQFMPTAFSPNGDNVNDILYFNALGVDRFKLQIYDRIGELVFESESFEKGWDGNYLGMPMNNNVFVYQIEIFFCDGEIVRESGNVTLVK